MQLHLADFFKHSMHKHRNRSTQSQYKFHTKTLIFPVMRAMIYYHIESILDSSNLYRYLQKPNLYQVHLSS